MKVSKSHSEMYQNFHGRQDRRMVKVLNSVSLLLCHNKLKMKKKIDVKNALCYH